MTINLADNTPRVVYSVAEGVTQTTFTVPFEFFESSDVSVYVDDTEQTEGSNYTVTGGDGSTGSITFSGGAVTGATGGSKVVLFRRVPLERTSDFNYGADINRGALNEQLDVLTAIAADLKDAQDRSLHVNDYENGTNLELPTIAARKGNSLVFNATTGNPEAGPPIADLTTLDDALTKLATIEESADVTDTANVTAAGALMDSELTSIASVKALNQGVATTDSPSFAGLTVDTDTLYVDAANNRVGIGTSSPNSALHVGSSGAVSTQVTSTGDNAGFLIQAAAGYVSRLWMGDTTDYDVGSIQYLHTSNAMTFTVNASERLRIDSSGNILIGTSTTGASVLRIVGLPTSSAGLSAGDVWNDGGTLKIV